MEKDNTRRSTVLIFTEWVPQVNGMNRCFGSMPDGEQDQVAEAADYLRWKGIIERTTRAVRLRGHCGRRGI